MNSNVYVIQQQQQHQPSLFLGSNSLFTASYFLHHLGVGTLRRWRFGLGLIPVSAIPTVDLRRIPCNRLGTAWQKILCYLGRLGDVQSNGQDSFLSRHTINVRKCSSGRGVVLVVVVDAVAMD